MTPVYKFRVKFEDYDDVTRDIEVKPTQTFRQFFECIQQSINFDQLEPASFFMSNDLWKKLREIASVEKFTKDGKPVATFDNAVLNKFILDPHQRIYYVFGNWTFLIELIKIYKVDDAKAVFPRCIKSVGEAPKQYKPVSPVGSAAPVTDSDETELEPLDSEIDEAATETTEEIFEDDHGFEGEEGADDESIEEEDSDNSDSSDFNDN